MTLKETIYRRKSVRSYTGKPVDAQTIHGIQVFFTTVKPLYPDIAVRMEIVSREDVKCILPWTTPQLIAMFSEDKPGALENIGFIFQQMDLYLQSNGLGTCWLGMGRLDKKSAVTREDGLVCMMLMTFGFPKGSGLRGDTSEFKRKTMEQIADRKDERLEPARLAPSSVNSQPWFFSHEGERVHVYCARHGIIRMLSDMNRIDVGIALAHLYVSNPEDFEFSIVDAPEMKGYGYIGSCTI